MSWQQFEDIEIWQELRSITNEIHMLIRHFEWSLYGGLRRQMIDLSGSVMDNIAEGFEWGSNHEFKTFLGYSRGSNGELRSQLFRCSDYGLIDNLQFESLNKRLIIQIKRHKKLIDSLNTNSQRGFQLNRFE